MSVLNRRTLQSPARAPASEELSALRRHGDSMVRPGDADHAVNVLAGGPPDWLTAALARTDITRYPDASAAREAVAALHGRRPEEVVLTNGASEALWILGPALAPVHAGLIQPGFTETEAALRAHGVPVQRLFADQSGSADAAELGIPDNIDLLVITNPTSPDGRLRDRDTLQRLRAPGRTVVVDEAFMSMVPGEPGSLAGESLEDVIVVRSMTKLLSVPGLRVGYALAAPETAERLNALKPPWSANAHALSALTAAASRPDDLAALAQRAAADRRDLSARLERIPELTVHPSHTNYVLITVPDGPGLVAALRDRAIAVRPAASFPGCGEDDIRLTARDPDANARLAAAITEALA